MGNEERMGPNIQKQADRADEVQRRNDVAPPGPPPVRDRMSDAERAKTTAAIESEAGRGDIDTAARAEALFPTADSTRLRNQWTEIQSGFVDEPKSAVKRADALVGDVLKNLSDSFAKERGKLESQWDHDGDVSTEDFRVAFRRYRAFFDRLLSI